MIAIGKLQPGRRAVCMVIVALAAVPAWNVIPLQAEPSAKKPSFDTYRLVKTRNIFDPDRRSMASTPQATQPATKPVTRSDYVALTGVMVTDEKSLAFFSGSRSEYNKVLPEKSSIAGATVLKITASNILVERDGRQITVAVGQTVPLDGSAPVAAPAPPTDDTASSSSSTNSNSNPNSNSRSNSGSQSSSRNAPSTDRSEIMRRMMERRQQQLK